MLDQPSIVHTWDSGEEGELLWYAMELGEGPSLADSRGRLYAADEAARLGEALADALAYSHARGVLHRDVKPENVILAPDGRPMLMDFGIAKAADSSVRTKTGFLVGSPAYVSPEQLAGMPLDGRTDVYSLGTTLFELVAGRLPFRAHGIEDLARRIDEDAPPLSRFQDDADPGLERIVERRSRATGGTATTRRVSGTRSARSARGARRPLEARARLLQMALDFVKGIR